MLLEVGSFKLEAARTLVSIIPESLTQDFSGGKKRYNEVNYGLAKQNILYNDT